MKQGSNELRAMSVCTTAISVIKVGNDKTSSDAFRKRRKHSVSGPHNNDR